MCETNTPQPVGEVWLFSLGAGVQFPFKVLALHVIVQKESEVDSANASGTQALTLRRVCGFTGLRVCGFEGRGDNMI